jgi:hypothetical protein
MTAEDETYCEERSECNLTVKNNYTTPRKTTKIAKYAEFN